jgi:NAD(P)H-dependent FMN reductase
MNHPIKITAIIGTYRKGGIINQAVDAIIESAKEEGAEVEKIVLLDKHIEFCNNCRACTQEEGPRPGKCPIADDMNGILDQIERSDAIILASPMNFWTVTAVMKRFIERLVCFAYWPWGKAAPKMRSNQKTKRAVIVASSAAPAFLARLVTRMVGLLKSVAGIFGAKTIGVLFIGLAAAEQHPTLSDRNIKKAHRLGKLLAKRV